MKIYSLILLLLLIYGCNDTTTTENKKTNDLAITSSDLIIAVQIGNETSINLSSNIYASQSADLYISDITSSPNQDNSCRIDSIKKLSFNISPDTAVSCSYTYTISDADKTTESSSYMRIVSSPQVLTNNPVYLSSDDVTMFSAVTQLNETITVDVAVANTTLDSTSIVVLGSGEAVYNPPNSITYTAGSDLSNTGITRIIFSYIDTGSPPKITLGTLDISVSTDTISYPPVSPSFRYGDLSYKSELIASKIEQLPYIEVEINKEAVIDIAPYYDKGLVDKDQNKIELIDSNGDPILDDNGNTVYFYKDVNGNYTNMYSSDVVLGDGDGDPVQLINTMVYNAIVSPLSPDDSSGFNITSFTFKAKKNGLYYVTYELSDHNGTYNSGIIEVLVGPKARDKPWEDLQTTNQRFTAPLSGEEAENGFIYFDSISMEDGTTGPDTYGTPLLSWTDANTYCLSINAKLPTLNQLSALITDYPDGLFESIDVHNPDSASQSKTVNWPTKQPYWTDTFDDTNNDKFHVIPLYAGLYAYDATQSATKDKAFSVTCILPGKLESLSVTKNDAFVQPYDRHRFNTVTAKLVDFNGAPIEGEKIRFSAQYNVFLEPNEAITDGNGEATINVLSRISGKIKISAQVFRTKKEVYLNFKPVSKYVRATTDGKNICFYDTIERMASDQCFQSNGELAIKDINFEGARYDTIFDDGSYIIRRYGGKIYTYTDIISAMLYPNKLAIPGGYGYQTKELTNGGYDHNSMFYDGLYCANAGGDYLDCYSTLTNMAMRKNVKKRYKENGPDNVAMVYDAKEKLYYRVVQKNDSSLYIRSYRTAETMIEYPNSYIEEIPYKSSTGVTRSDKFLVIN